MLALRSVVACDLLDYLCPVYGIAVVLPRDEQE